jgi:aspartyl-tRNA(Asn)/glutamyl-tRNA(Gln) amidotransferase subunit A
MLKIDPFASIHELGVLIRSKGVSPVSITEFFLDRIKRLDKKLGAFVNVMGDYATAQAKIAELELASGIDRGPLHGIPYAVKDLYHVAGFPTMAGTELLKNNVQEKDAFVISRLKEAGAVLLGKTHTVQFAYGGVGVNGQLGTPHNPWSKEAFIPGGSSSGSGVSVGAGMIPMALGSDTGGSVRIPASFNGVTGLKTTVGQVSRSGVFPLSWSLDSVGPLTRSPHDAALVYQALAKKDEDDPSMSAYRKVGEFNDQKHNFEGFKIAFPSDIFRDDCDLEVAEALDEAKHLIGKLGAHIVNEEFTAAREAVKLNPKGLVIAAEAYYSNRQIVDTHFDALDPIVTHRIIKGKDVTATEYLDITRRLQEVRKISEAFFEVCDAIIVPTVMIAPRRLSEVKDSIEMYAKTNLQCLRNTAIGNILNLSGVSIPCGYSKDSLPIGLMIYGKSFDEMKILSMAHAYQRHTDWHNKRPDLSWAQ